MRGPAKLALRIFLIIAVVGVVPMLFNSPGAARGPYVSALSSLSMPQAFAGSSCEFKDCAGGSRHNLVCAKVTSRTSCQIFQGTCLGSPCP